VASLVAPSQRDFHRRCLLRFFPYWTLLRRSGKKETKETEEKLMT
jgi:hypothetical protein